MNKKIKIMLAQLNPTVGDLEKNSKIVMDSYGTPLTSASI